MIRRLALVLLGAACALAAGAPLAAGAALPAGEGEPWPQQASVRISASQITIHTGREIADIVEHIDQAAADGAEMAVLGEYLLGPFHGHEGEGLLRVREAARRNGIYVVVGGWEEFEPGAYARLQADAYANTTLLIGRDGGIEGSFRKVHPAVGEPPHFWPPLPNDHEWRMKPGDGFHAMDVDFGRIGIMVCYDGYFPESARLLSLDGAEIILWLNGRPGPLEAFLVQADMLRNYTAMVATNLGQGSGTMIGIYPADILAHAPETGDHRIVADIDLGALRYVRANARMLHQRRPEAYGPLVEDSRPWEAYLERGFVPPPVPPRDAPLN